MLYRALHNVWRQIPRPWRRAAFFALTRATAPRPDPQPPAARLGDGSPYPITVAGQLTTASGLGEGARLALQALQAEGFDVRAADVSPAFDQSDLTVSLPPPPRPGEGGALIAHVNGPYLPFALRCLGAGAVRGRRVIGYWAWELPRLPDDWRHGFPFVHEVWVPSRFTADAVAAAGLPVRVVPHPLPEPGPAAYGRAHFDLPDDAFVAVSFFHMGSSFVRKNPVAAIAAFRQAFGDDPGKILLVKVSEATLEPAALAGLQNAVAGAANIRIIDRKMPRDEVDSLIAAADAAISLHRAEGFGLVPAEAMARGKAVVATGWSGNLDFMTADNSLLIGWKPVPALDPQSTYQCPDQCWADADVGEAAAALRRLADAPTWRLELGARAAADIRRRLSPAAFARTVRDALADPVIPLRR
jgi:glycosyltransferase involved in cell wall biosynthesis